MVQGEPGTGPRSRELRLALAMRGGVSLAVWIGGTCCEIEQLRTADRGSGFWGRLLESSGYGSVAVDVLAGASAGGLNGVIYAAAQEYGFSMDELRELWISVGDTAKLLRSKDDADADGWPSLFKGDGYFYTEARKALAKLAGSATPPDRRHPLTLTLSATLVEPVRRPGRSPSDEPLTQLRFASGFVFEQPAQPWQDGDFPTGDEAREQALSRLALAARSTSSFPAAFEAARIWSTRPPSFTRPVERSGDGLQVDMGGVFADRGTPDAASPEFLVADGGILDNIPLGRALDAIAHAAADGPTDRYLLYVQPGAPARPAPGKDPRELRERRATLSVLQGLLGARLPNEDIIGDLAQLDTYNTGVERARSLRRSGFQALTDQAALRRAAEAAWAGYRVLRAEEDERQVTGLLDDPLRVLGEDPFPSHVGGRAVPDDRWRSPLDGPGAPLLSRQQLAVTLTEAFYLRLPARFPATDDGQDRVVAVGAQPLLRITGLLIEWAQHLEAEGCDAGALKAQLYTVAAFVRDAVERPRRLGWVTLAATVPPQGTERDLQAGAAVLTDLMLLDSVETARICGALRDPQAPPEVLAAAVAGRLAALDGLPARAWDGQPAATAGPATDLRVAILRDVLVPIAGDLQRLAPAPPAGAAAAARAAEERWPTLTAGGYLHRVLDGDIGYATLEALDVVAFPEFAAGLPGRRPVKFRRLSAANPTPLASRFAALLPADDQPDLWWDPANTDRATQQGIHVTLKLAGNELANFSAFLHDKWRSNDWMWGRLDTVPTLVDLLLAGEQFRRGTDAPDPDRVRDLVAGRADRPSPLRDFLLAQVLDPQTVQAAAAELAAATGPMPVLARALTAARQWEILAQELQITDPADLLARVATYDVGAQTINSDEVRHAVAERLDAIAGVVDDVAIYCAQLRFTDGALGTPEDPTFASGMLRKAIEVVTTHAAKRLTHG